MADYTFPVWVSLSSRSPYKTDIKVNNILIGAQKRKVYSKEELARLKPVEKFLIVEPVEETNVAEDVTVSDEAGIPEKIKKTRKKKGA